MKLKRGLILTGVLSLMLIGVVYASIFQDSTQSNFDSGIYTNTTYNGSAVVLVGENSTGTYTSQIFNSNSSSCKNFSRLKKANTVKAISF